MTKRVLLRLNPPGGGKVSHTANTLDTGTQVTLTAIPAPSYRFHSWDGDSSGSQNPITVTLDTDKNITANFARVCSINTLVNPPGSGTVLRSPDDLDIGTQVTITAIAAPNYRFHSWGGDISGSQNPVTITLDTDKNITANFIAVYKLTTLVNPPRSGIVSPSPYQGSFDGGTPVTLTATPVPGYRFHSWSGGVSGNQNPIAITIDRNTKIMATFVRRYDPASLFSRMVTIVREQDFLSKVLLSVTVIAIVFFLVAILWFPRVIPWTFMKSPAVLTPSTPIKVLGQKLEETEQISPRLGIADFNTLVTKSKDLLSDLKGAESGIALKDWTKIGNSLGSLKGNLGAIRLLLPNVETGLTARDRERLGDFFSQTERVIQQMTADIDGILTKEPAFSLPSSNELKDTLNAIEEDNNNLKSRNRQLENDIVSLQDQYQTAWHHRWAQIMYLIERALPWLGLSILIGFAIAIPWYKKFADEEAFYRISATETGRRSPINIMFYASVGMAVVVVGYMLLKGYISLLL